MQDFFSENSAIKKSKVKKSKVASNTGSKQRYRYLTTLDHAITTVARIPESLINNKSYLPWHMRMVRVLGPTKYLELATLAVKHSTAPYKLFAALLKEAVGEMYEQG
jgi:hypothetical protein